MDIKKLLDNVLMEYLNKGLEGDGVQGQINLLKASIAKEVIIRIKADMAEETRKLK